MAAEEPERERAGVLHGLEEWLEKPMLVLGLAWLVLLVLELTRGLSAGLQTLGTVIWVVFLLDFGLRFALAPRKGRYLRSNWLTALSLLVPALRVLRLFRLLRVLRLARATRGIRLIRVIGSLNRGMRTLGKSMARRGFGYVLALTLLVTFVGAAGMLAFERETPGGKVLNDYGTALWWTAMMMTTMGSEYWPKSGEGRLLCLFLAIYAFAVFGYVTATLATFFIGQDAAAAKKKKDERGLAEGPPIEALRREIRELREELCQARRLATPDARMEQPPPH